MKHLSFLFISLMITWLPNAHSYENSIFNDFEGQPKTVEEYLSKDKWTVLMIWRHDCHVCNEEIAGYTFFHEGNDLAQVVGLSIDGTNNKEGAKAFIENHDIPFRNLIGEPSAVAHYYQSQSNQRFRGTPSFLVFNPDGELKAAQSSAVPPDVITKFIESQRKTGESGS